jgi:hypothetical protein
MKPIPVTRRQEIIACCILAGMSMGIVIAGLLIVVDGINNNLTNAPKPKYKEESYQLEDGTPCTILRGNHLLDITCDYDKRSKGIK